MRFQFVVSDVDAAKLVRLSNAMDEDDFLHYVDEDALDMVRPDRLYVDVAFGCLSREVNGGSLVMDVQSHERGGRSQGFPDSCIFGLRTI